MLTKAGLKKGDGVNQTEMVKKRILKIEKILLSTEELLQALDRYGRLNSLGKRQLSEVNGYLVTLRAILRIRSSSDIDEIFIFSGGVSSTGGFNIMIKKITDIGLPRRLPYPQGRVLSNRQGLSAAEYTHRNENRFIDGVVAQIDKGASIRDNNQSDKMAQTRAEDQINVTSIRQIWKIK